MKVSGGAARPPGRSGPPAPAARERPDPRAEGRAGVPPAPVRPDAPRPPTPPLTAAAAAEALRVEALRVETLRAAAAARIGTGDMRREMTRLLDGVSGLAPDARSARVAAWVIRGELRKLRVLDGFTGGYIRG